MIKRDVLNDSISFDENYVDNSKDISAHIVQKHEQMAENRAGYNNFYLFHKTKNIPVKPLKDLLEDTLTANIISPVLRSFFHNASKHPAIWSNTASISAKVRKLADLGPSKAIRHDR
ncbi:8246_t:CDS:2 [Funneliformis caledonium]|uniref:8246_t:CDS:1 n=1 Tax=Funneliformis caledonium TaxID=1117310 RepID=A0A9N9BQN9_9GLOM|nr:8246_t:CDS:2 [Funneliformis caledonium]